MLFPNLSLTWNIVILILLGLFAIYLIGYIAVATIVGSYRRQIKKDNRGVRVAMSTKLDILRKCQAVMEANKIKMSDECYIKLRYLDTEDFLQVQTEDFDKSRADLNFVENEIRGYVTTKRKLLKNEEAEILRLLLQDINESLKTSINAYNTDVLGYNYWVKFPLYRFIFLIFKAKPYKEII